MGHPEVIGCHLSLGYVDTCNSIVWVLGDATVMGEVVARMDGDEVHVLTPRHRVKEFGLRYQATRADAVEVFGICGVR